MTLQTFYKPLNARNQNPKVARWFHTTWWCNMYTSKNSSYTYHPPIIHHHLRKIAWMSWMFPRFWATPQPPLHHGWFPFWTWPISRLLGFTIQRNHHWEIPTELWDTGTRIPQTSVSHARKHSMPLVRLLGAGFFSKVWMVYRGTWMDMGYYGIHHQLILH